MYNNIIYSEYATRSAKRIFIKNSLDHIDIELLDDVDDIAFHLGINDSEGKQFISEYLSVRNENKRKKLQNELELERKRKLKERNESISNSSSNSDLGLTGVTMGIVATNYDGYDSYSGSSSSSSSSSYSGCSSSSSSSSSSDSGSSDSGGCD